MAGRLEMSTSGTTRQLVVDVTGQLGLTLIALGFHGGKKSLQHIHGHGRALGSLRWDSTIGVGDFERGQFEDGLYFR